MADHEAHVAPRVIRILFVEDDPVDAMLIREQLSEIGNGYAIAHARRLDAALDLLVDQVFDLVLLDLDVGDSMGLDTYDRLHAAQPELPVIVLTGHEDPDDIAELLRRGVQDCLMKGTGVETLLPRTISYAIERNRVRTRLNQSLARISESEERLRNLIDANADAVLLIDMEGYVRFANRAAGQMFGKRPEALVGTMLGTPIGNGVPVELNIQRNDGGQGVAELRVARSEWQGQAVFVASLRDVTLRVETERALRKSEQKLIRSERHLETAQRIASIGSFELDPETMACAPSEQLRAMLGDPDLTLIAWEDFLFRCIPEASQDEVIAAVRTSLDGGLSKRVECDFRRHDGSLRRALIRCDCLPGTPDLPRRLIGVVRDITELREAQARQAESEAQLRHAQKLEALGTLAGGIAHDLNNTLVPITAIGSVLLEQAGEDALMRQSVSLVLEAADRAKGLVKEILAFSRKGSAERELVRLDLLVEDSMRVICAGLPPNIRCRTQLDPVPPISGHRGQLYQVVLNLVTNAGQAIGSAEGTVTIGVESVQPGLVHLYVEDDGPGMSEDTQRRIFEPFFTTRAASDGTGLGLAVASGIVADHHGKIRVSSTPGKGTRFDLEFVLPMEEEA